MTRKRFPSLNWLRVYDVAARRENFTRAAEELHMSASAVSQQITLLERHLGVKLFHRMPQKIQLTEKGRAFLPTVQQALASIETTAAALFDSEDQMVVNIQVIAIMAMGWLPDRLREFEARYPEIRVHVTTGNVAADFRNNFLGEQPDFQIVFGAFTDFPETAAKIMDETLFPVARPDMAAMVKSATSLLDRRLIEVASHRSGWHQVLAKAGISDLAGIDMTFVDSTPLALMMARAGNGIALNRSPASDSMTRALGLERLAVIEPVRGVQSYFLSEPMHRPLSPAAQKLKDWIT